MLIHPRIDAAPATTCVSPKKYMKSLAVLLSFSPILLSTAAPTGEASGTATALPNVDPAQQTAVSNKWNPPNPPNYIPLLFSNNWGYVTENFNREEQGLMDSRETITDGVHVGIAEGQDPAGTDESVSTAATTQLDNVKSKKVDFNSNNFSKRSRARNPRQQPSKGLKKITPTLANIDDTLADEGGELSEQPVEKPIAAFVGRGEIDALANDQEDESPLSERDADNKSQPKSEFPTPALPDTPIASSHLTDGIIFDPDDSDNKYLTADDGDQDTLQSTAKKDFRSVGEARVSPVNPRKRSRARQQPSKEFKKPTSKELKKPTSKELKKPTSKELKKKTRDADRAENEMLKELTKAASKEAALFESKSLETSRANMANVNEPIQKAMQYFISADEFFDGFVARLSQNGVAIPEKLMSTEIRARLQSTLKGSSSAYSDKDVFLFNSVNALTMAIDTIVTEDLKSRANSVFKLNARLFLHTWFRERDEQAFTLTFLQTRSLIGKLKLELIYVPTLKSAFADLKKTKLINEFKSTDLIRDIIKVDAVRVDGERGFRFIEAPLKFRKDVDFESHEVMLPPMEYKNAEFMYDVLIKEWRSNGWAMPEVSDKEEFLASFEDLMSPPEQLQSGDNLASNFINFLIIRSKLVLNMPAFGSLAGKLSLATGIAESKKISAPALKLNDAIMIAQKAGLFKGIAKKTAEFFEQWIDVDG